MKAWYLSGSDDLTVKKHGACLDMQGVTGYTGILKDGSNCGSVPGPIADNSWMSSSDDRILSFCVRLDSRFFPDHKMHLVVLSIIL